MNIISLLALLILFFSFLGGLKDGAVKSASSLLAQIISIPIAGAFYPVLAGFLSFLPGTDWENFLGFFIALGIMNAIFHFIFFVPRKIIGAMWGEGPLWRLVGGAVNALSASIGLTVLALSTLAFPIISWPAEQVAQSGVLAWLVGRLGFVVALLPEAIRQAATTVT